MSARLRDWAPELLLLVVTTGAGLWAGGRWVSPVGDMGRWWSLVHRLSQGERLYADVYFSYGPLSPQALTALSRVFGQGPSFFLLVNWIPAVLAALLLMRVGRGLLSPFERVALGALLLGLSLFAPGPGRLVYPYAPAASHALLLAAAGLLLHGGVSLPPWRAAAAGGLAALAFGCKQEVGVAALAAMGLGLAADPTSRRRVGPLLAGFAAVALPLAAWVLSAAPLPLLRSASVVWPLALSVPEPWAFLYRSVSGAHHPRLLAIVAQSGALLAATVAGAALVGLLWTQSRGRSRWAAGAVLASALAWLAWAEGPVRPAQVVSLFVAASVLQAAAGLRDPEPAERRRLVAVGVLAALVGSRAAFAPGIRGEYMGFVHFAPCLAVTLLLCRDAPGLFCQGRARAVARTAVAAVLLVAGAHFTGVGIVRLRSPEHVPVDTRRGTVWMDRERARLFRAMDRELAPGERVLLLPESWGADALLELRDVSPYSLHLPGWLDPAEEAALVQQLVREPPSAVVVFTRPVPEYGVPGPLGEGYALSLGAWVRQRFEKAAGLPAGTIYRPRAWSVSPPASRPAATARQAEFDPPAPRP